MFTVRARWGLVAQFPAPLKGALTPAEFYLNPLTLSVTFNLPLSPNSPGPVPS